LGEREMKRMLEERDMVVTMDDIEEITQDDFRVPYDDGFKEFNDLVAEKLKEKLVYIIPGIIDEVIKDLKEQQEWTTDKLDEEERQNVKDGWRR
jgi:hypothetical protein